MYQDLFPILKKRREKVYTGYETVIPAFYSFFVLILLSVERKRSELTDPCIFIYIQVLLHRRNTHAYM
jgi:hypothetical protein